MGKKNRKSKTKGVEKKQKHPIPPSIKTVEPNIENHSYGSKHKVYRNNLQNFTSYLCSKFPTQEFDTIQSVVDAVEALATTKPSMSMEAYQMLIDAQCMIDSIKVNGHYSLEFQIVNHLLVYFIILLDPLFKVLPSSSCIVDTTVDPFGSEVEGELADGRTSPTSSNGSFERSYSSQDKHNFKAYLYMQLNILDETCVVSLQDLIHGTDSMKVGFFMDSVRGCVVWNTSVWSSVVDSMLEDKFQDMTTLVLGGTWSVQMMERLHLVENQIYQAIPYLDYSFYNVLILYRYSHHVQVMVHAGMTRIDAVHTLGRLAKATVRTLITHWTSCLNKERRHVLKNSNLVRSKIDDIFMNIVDTFAQEQDDTDRFEIFICFVLPQVDLFMDLARSGAKIRDDGRMMWNENVNPMCEREDLSYFVYDYLIPQYCSSGDSVVKTMPHWPFPQGELPYSIKGEAVSITSAFFSGIVLESIMGFTGNNQIKKMSIRAKLALRHGQPTTDTQDIAFWNPLSAGIQITHAIISKNDPLLDQVAQLYHVLRTHGSLSQDIEPLQLLKQRNELDIQRLMLPLNENDPDANSYYEFFDPYEVHKSLLFLNRFVILDACKEFLESCKLFLIKDAAESGPSWLKRFYFSLQDAEEEPEETKTVVMFLQDAFKNVEHTEKYRSIF